MRCISDVGMTNNDDVDDHGNNVSTKCLSNCFVKTRRHDRQRWTCHSSRDILASVNEALSQTTHVDTTLVNSLLTSLQQTRECLFVFSHVNQSFICSESQI